MSGWSTVRKGPVTRPPYWRWSSHNNFALDQATVAACPIQIDHVRLPEVAGVRKAHDQNSRRGDTVATRCWC